MNTSTVLVDVRDDIRNGREPFSKIMNAVSRLRTGENLLLLAPFEPFPLVHILNKQGFRHQAHSNQAGDWEVLFERVSAQPADETAPKGNHPQANPASTSSNSVEEIEVEARGLEPPLPMVKILETLATLPAGGGLRARTDRRPIHLYPQLEQRGFAARTEQQPDGSFITHIRPH